MGYDSQVCLILAAEFDAELRSEIAAIPDPELAGNVARLLGKAERSADPDTGVVLYFFDWTHWYELEDPAVIALLEIFGSFPPEAYEYHCLGEEDGDYEVKGRLDPPDAFEIRLVRHLVVARASS